MLSTLLILVPGSVISYYIFEHCCEDSEHKLEKKLKKLSPQEKRLFVLKNVNYISSSFFRDYLQELNFSLETPRWDFRSIDAIRLQLEHFSSQLLVHLAEDKLVAEEQLYKHALITELHHSLNNWEKSLQEFSQVLLRMSTAMDIPQEKEISRQIRTLSQKNSTYLKVY
ncbi:MAG: hypothetical protein HRT88_04340 [Lentisphaeraceae bacterium]|nr:hypothetical protein [Lentisphaeraceae bacterium]